MIKIVAVGKIKESFLRDGIDEYVKRIKAFDKIEIIEVKEYNTDNIKQNILNEGEAILKEINDKDYLITLEIKGKELDSIELSQKIDEIKCYNSSTITFVIGGSNGLSPMVSEKSNFKLSFSKMTFPHQLMRLILVEQIYRANTILANKEYHK